MKKALIFIFLIIVIAYLVFIFAVPKLINSTTLISSIENKIKQETGYEPIHKNLVFKSNYNTSSLLTLDELEILNKDKKRVLFINKAVLNFKPFHLMPQKISLNYLFFDKTNYTGNSNSKFDFKNLPEISINKADIVIQKDSIFSLVNLKTKYEDKSYTASFRGEIKHKKLKIGVELNSSPIFINGKFTKNSYDFTLKGNSIPIKDIKEAFLAYRKRIKPYEKNFIENFYDFRGTVDINLNFKPKNINGTATLSNFYFKSTKFSIPFYYPKSVFYFKKDTISLKTKGTFASKPLYTDYFYFNKTSKGTLISSANSEFARKYLPELSVKGNLNLKVKYVIKNRTPEVEYYITPEKGSSISYKWLVLDKNIFAKTTKKDNMLYLSYFSIVNGSGVFKKINNKFKLQYITLSAKKYVPIIKTGYFKGDIKYDTNKKEAAGNGYIFFKNFQYKKLALKNFEIKCDINKNIINFISSNIIFANGYIKAKGIYDLKNQTSNILFSADDIDSNIASDILFNLKDQIKGKASAKMHFISHKKDIKAHVDFSIEEGGFLKLSNAEFLIKNSKHRLQNIINYDLRKAKTLNSYIKGQFDFDSKQIKNAEIFNQNRYLSFYIQGCYNMQQEYICAIIWGKYNKSTQRGIKIFFIPLSWITKFIFKNEYTKEFYKKQIEKIPPIEASEKQIEIIRAKVEGNINTAKNIKVDLKSIR